MAIVQDKKAKNSQGQMIRNDYKAVNLYNYINTGKTNKYGLPVGLTPTKLQSLKKQVIRNEIYTGGNKYDISTIERTYNKIIKNANRVADKSTDHNKVMYSKKLLKKSFTTEKVLNLGFGAPHVKPIKKQFEFRIPKVPKNPLTQKIAAQTKLSDAAIRRFKTAKYIPKSFRKFEPAIKLNAAGGLDFNADMVEDIAQATLSKEMQKVFIDMGGIKKALKNYSEQIYQVAKHYGDDIDAIAKIVSAK